MVVLLVARAAHVTDPFPSLSKMYFAFYQCTQLDCSNPLPPTQDELIKLIPVVIN